MRYVMTKPAMNIWNDVDRAYNATRTPAVDIREEEDQFLIEAELPGYSEKDMDIKVEDNLLTLKAEKKESSEEVSYLRKERSSRDYKRTFVLPRNVDSKNIKADFKDGILTLSLGKKEEAKPVSIKINSK